MICLWARLRDGDQAAFHVQEILRTSTLDSLLDDHPPFQIDGNFGAVAGITECLVQSHEKAIVLLPALPSAWAEGEVSGICARGGFEVSLRWGKGLLLGGNVVSKLGRRCRIESKQSLRIVVEGKVVVESTVGSYEVKFETRRDESYEIQVRL